MDIFFKDFKSILLCQFNDLIEFGPWDKLSLEHNYELGFIFIFKNLQSGLDFITLPWLELIYPTVRNLNYCYYH
jgi:hypothetical protein